MIEMRRLKIVVIFIQTILSFVLSRKINHYGVRGVLNDWFRSYLSNRQQYVSINGYDSGLIKINCGVPQRYVIGPLPFFFFCYISMTLSKP